MKSTSIKVIESIRLTSLVAVAFLSSAITVAMVGILLAAFNFGFIGGVDPVLTFLSSFGATTRFSQQASLGGNYTQIAKVDIQDSLGGKSSLSASVVFKSPVHASPETLAETTADPAVSESASAKSARGAELQSSSGWLTAEYTPQNCSGRFETDDQIRSPPDRPAVTSVPSATRPAEAQTFPPEAPAEAAD